MTANRLFFFNTRKGEREEKTMKQFVTTMQYVFAAMGGAIGAVLGGFDGFLYALIVFVVVD